MSFLLGAFGKLAAGRRVRDLQSRMMRVQSRLRRATRDVANMEKSLQRQEQSALNALKSQGMLARQTALNGLNMQTNLGALLGAANPDTSAISSAQAQFNTGAADINTRFEAQLQFAQENLSNQFEWLRESQLEPLKNEEEMLQTEKDSLESQLQIAQADYKACQDMEKSDAKNLAPNYTGQG